MQRDAERRREAQRGTESATFASSAPNSERSEVFSSSSSFMRLTFR